MHDSNKHDYRDQVDVLLYSAELLDLYDYVDAATAHAWTWVPGLYLMPGLDSRADGMMTMHRAMAPCDMIAVTPKGTLLIALPRCMVYEPVSCNQVRDVLDAKRTARNLPHRAAAFVVGHTARKERIHTFDGMYVSVETVYVTEMGFKKLAHPTLAGRHVEVFFDTTLKTHFVMFLPPGIESLSED